MKNPPKAFPLQTVSGSRCWGVGSCRQGLLGGTLHIHWATVKLGNILAVCTRRAILVGLMRTYLVQYSFMLHLWSWLSNFVGEFHCKRNHSLPCLLLPIEQTVTCFICWDHSREILNTCESLCFCFITDRCRAGMTDVFASMMCVWPIGLWDYYQRLVCGVPLQSSQTENPDCQI